MNEETVKLIDKLASKLGTTSEYLWIVLLKQAPIDAVYHIIVIIVNLLAIYAIYRIHKYLLNENNKFNYEDYEAAWALTILLSVVAVFMFLVNMVNVHHIINGFFNPEFWAMNYIIEHLK